MLMTKRVKGLIFASALLLTSCASITPPASPPTQESWATRQAKLARVNNYDINGKIAVRTAQDAGSATIHWTQNGGSYVIALFGPLGTNGMTLRGREGAVTMETADGKQHSAKNAEELLASQWGYHLPVSYLRYWIRGLPVPGLASNQQFDAYHRLSQLTQQGWRVEFASYTNSNGVELPQRINVTSPGLSAKLIIYSWKIS